LLTLLCTCTPGFAVEPSLASAHSAPIITRQGDKLYEGAKEFRYVSVNMPDVLQIISNYRFDGDTATTRLRHLTTAVTAFSSARASGRRC
jgi:hypothetical protein